MHLHTHASMPILYSTLCDTFYYQTRPNIYFFVIINLKLYKLVDWMKKISQLDVLGFFGIYIYPLAIRDTADDRGFLAQEPIRILFANTPILLFVFHFIIRDLSIYILQISSLFKE
jgi:hypothetical protein